MEVIWDGLCQELSFKEDETSTSSLPSPSPELSHAQALSQEQPSQLWPTHSKGQVASTNSDSLPSPTPESPHTQPWTLGQPFLLQQSVNHDKDNAATTTNPTSLPSPPFDLSIGASWIESEDNVFDSLFETRTGHAFSDYGTTPLSSLHESSTAFEYGGSDAFSGCDTPLSSAGNELGVTRLSAGLEPDAPQLISHSLMETFATTGYGTVSSSLRIDAALNMEQPADNRMALSFMSAEDLVQALVTPVSELFEAGKPDDKVEPATLLCVQPNDLIFEAAIEDKSIDQSTSGPVFLLPQDTVVTVTVSTVASRRVRFDMTPHIKVLDLTRVTGPPKEFDEEHIDDIMRRARWEYRWDMDLRQEHKLSKRASFNAHLHAAFPVDTQDEQASDEQQSNQHSTDDCLSKKRSIDSDDEGNFLTDERHAKKHRTDEHTSNSPSSSSSNPFSNEHTIEQLGVKEILANNCSATNTQINKHTTIDHVANADTTDDEALNVVSAIKKHAVMEPEAEDVLVQHPDFDEMVKDDQIGRSYRLFRWNLYYPALYNEDFEEDELSQEDSDDLDFEGGGDNDDGVELHPQQG
ncbi:hypothetical protein BGZ96_005341 [Linnemannia gamsii]|uniref:Uncharacterized protein n=1 Tax=Linnemannia gamsii TaxID=64522 RepID=A0ABQ7KEK8_9FUNG|nr:hypothetical protein BGZ96_005341 [Linnemannia gamsii]